MVVFMVLGSALVSFNMGLASKLYIIFDSFGNLFHIFILSCGKSMHSRFFMVMKNLRPVIGFPILRLLSFLRLGLLVCLYFFQSSLTTELT